MKVDCLFCKIASGELPASIVYEDNDIIAFDDIKPQAPIHIIIVIKKHIDKISSLKPEDSALASSLIMAGIKIAREKGISDKGYRMVINCGQNAGQDIAHIHMHLLASRKMAWPPG